MSIYFYCITINSFCKTTIIVTQQLDKIQFVKTGQVLFICDYPVAILQLYVYNLEKTDIKYKTGDNNGI